MNIVIMTGRLGKDPEIKYSTRGTAICEFSLAVDSGYGENKKTNWPNCVAWSKTAEWISEGAVKGDELTVKGELETGSYENQDGKKVYWTKVNVQEFRISKHVKRDEEEDRPEKKLESKKKSSYNPLDDEDD